jgi:hypothetical protein
MQTRRFYPGLLRGMGCIGLALFSLTSIWAASYEPLSVYSENFNGYKRARLPDGSLKPETFAFGEGERFDGMVANNLSNELSFRQVIGALAKPLAAQRYVAAPDAAHADLLIMVYWGVTNGSRDDLTLMDTGWSDINGTNLNPSTGLAGPQDMLNARLLGYAQKLELARDIPTFSIAQDIFDEIQESRYFIVMQAFDFQLLRKEHRQKLLWETRFSIREQGNAFAEQIRPMAVRASQFFGNGNGKLVRRAFPKAEVRVGDPIEVKDVK